MRLYFSPDPPPGGDGASEVTPEPPPTPETSPEATGPSAPPAGEPPPPSPAPGPATPPPAATTVIEARRTEREIELEAELGQERERHSTTAAEKRAREIRIAELEDELRRLKEAGLNPPKPARPRGRWTFFDQGD